MKQESPVEWLENRLNVYFKSKSNDTLWKIKQKFERAKQMEREQAEEIIDKIIKENGFISK
jgi:hypothetical protein